MRSGYFYILILLAYTSQAHGQWQINGIPLCNANAHQLNHVATSDTSGSIVAWEDYRNGNGDIYAQKISHSGVVLWSMNGIPICTAQDHQLWPVIASDAAGGAIIAWEDYRNAASSSGDIYIQRISSTGQAMWGANGLLVCNAANVQMRPAIASDGHGGAIIAWEDYRTNIGDIYVQRVASNGTVQWAANGIRAATIAGARYEPVIAAAGNGGAIIAWEENRIGVEYDIHAQYIASNGALQWGGGGRAVCTAPGMQTQLSAYSDVSGILLLAWQDYRNAVANPDIYAQILSVNGAAWQNNGVAVCTAAGTQEEPRLVSDGLGGMIVVWTDYRTNQGDIYAQRLNAFGAANWQANGVAVCTASGTQHDATIVPNGSGGAVIAWMDYRVAAGDVYAQLVSASGTRQWRANGVEICTANDTQQAPVIVSDHSGGGIVVWTDYRGQDGDIYAQRVDQYGTPLPVELLSFSGGRVDGGVLLQWRTVSETNLLGFDIQGRVDDGRFFSMGFIPASAPDGGGYEYFVCSDDATVFRLRFVDMDGSEGYSPELYIDTRQPAALSVHSLWPLPVSDLATLHLEAPANARLRIGIVDLAGRRRVHLEHTALGGRELLLLRTGALPSGMYILEVDDGISSVRRRLPVLR